MQILLSPITYGISTIELRYPVLYTSHRGSINDPIVVMDFQRYDFDEAIWFE